MIDLRVQALTDIWAFADLIDFRGGKDSFYSLHFEMTDFLCRHQIVAENKRENRRRLMLVPREHRKSTIGTVLYSLWRIYRNPNIRIVVACKDIDLSQDFIREMRQYLEDPDLIENVWNNRPHIAGPLIPKLTTKSSAYKRNLTGTEASDSKVVWTNYAIQVVRNLKDKQPTVKTASVNQSLGGKHCDIVIFDDVVSWDNCDTEPKNKKLRRWIGDIESVLTKKATLTEICPGFSEYVGGELIVIGTRYYAWDYYAHLSGLDEEEMQSRLAKTGYSAFIRDVYVNGVDSSGGYICPEIFDAEVERELIETESMTPQMFAAQFRNKIIADEDIVMTTDQLRIVPMFVYKRTTIKSVINYIEQREPTDTGHKVYQFHIKLVIDLASSQRDSADKSAYAIGGYDEKSQLHLIAAEKGRWTPSVHYRKIYDAAQHWQLSTVYYESGVGYQNVFSHNFKMWIQNENLHPIMVQPLSVPRSISKNDRIKMALQPMFHNNQIIVNASITNRNNELFDEIRFWNPTGTRNADEYLDLIEMLSRLCKPKRYKPTAANRDKLRHTKVNTMFGGVR